MDQLRHVGGSFAPPLDDKKLASYKAMAEALPPSPVRDGMLELHACVAQWWDLPESKGKGSPHPSGLGAIVPLDEEHQSALWEAIPWEKELALLADEFDGIERDVTERNSLKVHNWYRDVVALIVAEHFPEPSVFQGLCKILKSAGEWLGLLSKDSRTEIEAQFKKVEATRRDIKAALDLKDHPKLPYPTLEPTPVRDAAHMLLWHVKELNLDREPITTDKL